MAGDRLTEDEAVAATIASGAEARSRPPETRPDVGLVLSSERAAVVLEDDFEVLEELGRGGMGVVLIAKDKKLCRTVAVKVMSAPERQDLVSRFVTEAQVSAQLEHPNIVPLYQFEQTKDGNPAFAMKLISGLTFDDYIDECAEAERKLEADRGPYSLKTRLEHLVGVCNALAYAHDRSVIHRDIKPGNLMIGSYGEVYVMDWGLARVLGTPDEDAVHTDTDEEPVALVETDSKRHLTRAGQVLGTAPYMAPEQAAGAIHEVGPAADQYAVGLVLQEMVTLRLARPYTPGQSIQDQLRSAQDGLRNAVEHAYGAPVDPGLVAIIDKATARDAADRYPNMRAFADDIRRFIRDEELVARPDGLARRIWRRLSKHQNQVLWALLGILLIAATAVGGSMAKVIETQRRASQERDQLWAVGSKVIQRADEMLGRFGEMRLLVESLSGATLSMLEDAAPAATSRWYTNEQLAAGDAPSDFAEDPRYGQKVTFEAPAIVLAPGVGGPEIDTRLKRLVRLTPLLRETMLRGISERAPHRPPDEQNALLRATTDSDVALVYVAFEDGILVNYPGYASFAEGYDPRARPWYKDAVTLDGARFGRPYPDVSGTGILMPCLKPLLDAQGTLLGVVGADVPLDRVIGDMKFPELPGWLRSYLLTAEGRVVVDSASERLEMGEGLHDNQALDLGLFESQKVREALASGTHVGAVHDSESLYLYARLGAGRYYLVAQFDERWRRKSAQ